METYHSINIVDVGNGVEKRLSLTPENKILEIIQEILLEHGFPEENIDMPSTILRDLTIKLSTMDGMDRHKFLKMTDFEDIKAAI